MGEPGSEGGVRVLLQPGNERHDTGSHPENARRFPPVIRRLRESPDRNRLEIIESARPAALDDLARAHSGEHIERIRRAGADGPSWIDADTVVLVDSFDVARDAAGAAIRAVELAAGRIADPVRRQPEGEAPGPEPAGSTFALVRPPGHHATRDRAMGFCLFNNVAIAALHARERLGIERVAIFDWDVHHGNGTQDILYADPSVLFVSAHQWPLYPGTGWVDETGAGEGRGFTVNLPMPPGSGDREYLEAFTEVVRPVLERFDPGLVLISAGQDGHVADPLSDQQLTVAGYHAMAAAIAGFAGERQIGVAAVQEGGYNPETLPRLNHAILAGLGGFAPDLHEPDRPAEVGEIGWPERLREIRRAQRPHWGDL